MKKNFLFFILLAISISSVAQNTTSTSSLKRSDLLKKSKKQNTTGWILLGGGFAFATTGIIVGFRGAAEEIAGIFTGEESNKLETGAVFFYTGIAGMLGSIPLFIASGKNKRRASAITASFKMEKFTALRETAIIKSSYPAITVRFSL